MDPAGSHRSSIAHGSLVLAPCQSRASSYVAQNISQLQGSRISFSLRILCHPEPMTIDMVQACQHTYLFTAQIVHSASSMGPGRCPLLCQICQLFSQTISHMFAIHTAQQGPHVTPNLQHIPWLSPTWQRRAGQGLILAETARPRILVQVTQLAVDPWTTGTRCT